MPVHPAMQRSCRCSSAPLAAAERISRYDVLVEIAADAGVTITETIVIRAQGKNIHRRRTLMARLSGPLHRTARRFRQIMLS